MRKNKFWDAKKSTKKMVIFALLKRKIE